MIDLSHLTEEEQGVIMTVLRRDAELKRAEEERIRYKYVIHISNTAEVSVLLVQKTTNLLTSSYEAVIKFTSRY